MAESADIVGRKDQHLDLALTQRAGAAGRGSPFDRIGLEPCALPELDLDEVDVSTIFLGKPLKAPLLISSMTGGPNRGERINHNLAEAAGALRIALGVGSQRIALEGASDRGFSPRLRELARDAVLLANIGGAQLAKGYGVEEARRAVDMIGADGLIVHLNPLQEAVQPGGDTDWRGVLAGIEALCAGAGVPVVVKEVGFGISAPVARRLRNIGVSAIDVAGSGGTDWAAIEGGRSRAEADRATAQAFEGWGMPTPRALSEVRAACPDIGLIGSGGVRDGVDAAKAVALGADMVGQAGGVLEPALLSAEAVVEHFAIMIRQLRTTCFCTGAADLAALRKVRVFER